MVHSERIRNISGSRQITHVYLLHNSYLCVMYFVCVCYAEWNFNYSHYLLSVVCGVFPLLTVFALVDNSEFARCWLFKSGRRPPLGGNVWGFCPNVGQTFFEESRSRQTQQSFFHACSALPRSSYHNWATTTSHKHRKVTMAVFKILYIFFFQGVVIVWREVGASKCALFFTDIGCGEEVGWIGRGVVLGCWMGRGRTEVSEYCFLDRIRIRILFGIRILTEYEYE